jgi:hypothetical protein
MTNQTYIRKIGRNRGVQRIWLEGKCVAAAGFRPGDHFNIVHVDGAMVLVKSDDGDRKISGKGEKGIIDMAGSTISKSFPESVQSVVVESLPEGAIKITVNE